jgi:uncharacterized protein YfaP (DUF2135 family)
MQHPSLLKPACLPYLIYLTLLASALLPWAASAQVNIELPRGGWRHSAEEPAGFEQPVNYPASSVNSSGKRAAALIRGDIGSHQKGRPASLIVNGSAMPLEVDEAGHFERPYAFGSGSNSVEVRSSDGKARQRVQFYDGYRGKPQARLRVLLSWDSPGTDLDLHVVAPDGDHVFYGNRIGKDGGALDVDVTTGYGPEIYGNPAPKNGVYHVYVNYYGSGGDRSQELTVAQVAIVTQEGTLSEKRQVVQVPMRRAGELTLIKSFNYP